LFGENLTISAFAPHGVRIGDRYHVGSTVLEVSSARIPCATFAVRMNDLQFVRKFTQARRPGFYARVLVPGDVGAGDLVEVEPATEDAPTLMDIFDVFHDRNAPRAQLEWLLRYPVADRARAHYEARLADLA
jgi:MOSC domain-containing protein YiiM